MAKHRGIEFAATISSFRPPFLGIDVSSVKAFVLEQPEKKKLKQQRNKFA